MTLCAQTSLVDFYKAFLLRANLKSQLSTSILWPSTSHFSLPKAPSPTAPPHPTLFSSYLCYFSYTLPTKWTQRGQAVLAFRTLRRARLHSGKGPTSAPTSAPVSGDIGGGRETCQDRRAWHGRTGRSPGAGMVW